MLFLKLQYSRGGGWYSKNKKPQTFPFMHSVPLCPEDWLLDIDWITKDPWKAVWFYPFPTSGWNSLLRKPDCEFYLCTAYNLASALSSSSVLYNSGIKWFVRSSFLNIKRIVKLTLLFRAYTKWRLLGPSVFWYRYCFGCFIYVLGELLGWNPIICIYK